MVYYNDFQLNFMGLNIYNNPEIIFEQIWDEDNNSNNRKKTFYNIFGYEFCNFKAIRFFETEYTIGDLIMLVLFILILIFVYILNNYIVFFVESNNFQKIELQ